MKRVWYLCKRIISNAHSSHINSSNISNRRRTKKKRQILNWSECFIYWCISIEIGIPIGIKQKPKRMAIFVYWFTWCVEFRASDQSNTTKRRTITTYANSIPVPVWTDQTIFTTHCIQSVFIKIYWKQRVLHFCMTHPYRYFFVWCCC